MIIQTNSITIKTNNLFDMNNDFLKPIETFYKGYKFRSRLEARWAVFFDALGLKWQYEVEGFNLSDGRYYLPDFRVTSSKELVYWYEVKPSEDKGDGKLQRFALDWGAKHPDDRTTDFAILSGDPVDVLNDGLELLKGFKSRGRFFENKFCVCPRCAGIYSMSIADHDYEDIFFSCYTCDFHTPCGSGNPEEVGAIANVIPHKGDLRVSVENLKGYINKIETACNTARSARFEQKQSS